MNNFNNIQQKLQQFIKKYYTNELIKGLILFISFGLLYFLITVFIEYFLWLPPFARSVLFFVFIAVELGLFIKFIAIPLAKLFGLQKGISLSEASFIIGKHFSEVDDKLLNVLQLNEDKNQSELLLASIEQKSKNLEPIPFINAISFKGNIKYLKYLSIPILIWIFMLLTGNNSIFNESFDRVVHYKTAYEPPAPFSFVVLNDKLQDVEGQPFNLIVATEGSVVPENVTIHFNNESYMLKDLNGNFTHQFNNLKEPIEFYLEANDVRSRPYQLEVLRTPNVTGFEMYMNYPAYTGKKDELIKNTGNAVIPEGSTVTWNITTKATDSMKFVSEKRNAFTLKSENNFSISKRVSNTLNYQITTSNRGLKDYEKLDYTLQVIKDEYPKIEVKSDIDSVSRGPVQFVGQLSDDYGLKKLQLVYYDVKNKKALQIAPINVNKSTFEEFYYIFSPEILKIDLGKAYEMYFGVYDNDGSNGSKVTKSQIFAYYNKTQQEITDYLLKEQKQNLEELNKINNNSEKLNKELDEFSKKLRKKSDLNWNDKKEFDQFLKRQEQYKQMQEKHTENLKENLDEKERNDENAEIKDKKEELKKRIEEAQELQEKNNLLDQLKKMSEKLEKEEMLNKLDKLTEQNKQEKKTLERLLELSKRFFVEKKAAQITQKLDSLSGKQEEESKKEESKIQDQKELNKEFESIKKDFEELRKQNENLAQPMKFPDTKQEEKIIEELMERAKENLENKEAQENSSNKPDQKDQRKKDAKTNQKAAAKKQKELSKKMGGAMMEMQGEMLQENIDDLKAILENLLTFSFDQENLLDAFDGIDASHAEFPKLLRKQQIIKENFEHIDDSLYTLSLRVPQLTTKIQEDLADAHYNLNKSLDNIAENYVVPGRSNQQYTMTAANNLADMLSDMLNSLQNPSMGQGKGKGGKPEFSLPDIIKKQGELQEKMKEGMKKGEGEKKKGKDGEKGKEGEPKGGDGGSEQMSGEQYQIYQEQNALKEALKEMMGKDGKNGAKGQKAIKQMEQLEKQLLDKGFNNDVLQQMQQLEHELLKLEDAQLEQGKDTKRKSETNKNSFEQRTIPEIKGDKLFFSKDEILNREPLPLRNNYKKKVQQYFKETVKE